MLISNKIGYVLNHALIQKYKHGKDNIGEHSDKTIDIDRESSIINFSVGATRTMQLKKKEKNDKNT